MSADQAWENVAAAVERVLYSAAPGLNSAPHRYEDCDCHTWNRVPSTGGPDNDSQDVDHPEGWQ